MVRAWRKLLKLRPLAYDYLRYEINDGTSVSFWFDDWLGVGNLIYVTCDLGTRYLGVTRSATLVDVFDVYSWKIRSRGERWYPELYAKIAAASLPRPQSGADRVLWKNDTEDYKEIYSFATTRNSMRTKKINVSWPHLVCLDTVPRQSFMTWLVFHNRLSTVDRIKMWGIDQGCMLCGETNETRDHLFFACQYTYGWTLLGSCLKNLSSQIGMIWSQYCCTLLIVG